MSLVTVLLPVYNNKNDVINAIKSVQEQSYSLWELIIIDDCSTDQSFEICKEYTKDDQRIKLIRNNKNYGAYVSLNNGLLIAQGKYITVIGSDDTFHPDKLLKQVKELDTNPKIMGTICLFKRGNDMPKKGESTLMFRKSVIEKIGYYDSVRFGADTEFLERLVSVYKKSSILTLNEVLYFAKIRHNSLTRNKKTGTGSIKIRKSYIKSYKEWHSKKKTYMPYPLIQRPFIVNSVMLP